MHAHARRLRRAGDQDRKPEGRRLRAALRRCRQRPCCALRLGQPRQGIGDPGPQVPGRYRPAAPAARRCRRVGVESHARIDGAAGRRPRRYGGAAPGRDRGRNRRLWTGRADISQTRVRPARPGGVGSVRRHRQAGGAGEAGPSRRRRLQRALRGAFDRRDAVRPEPPGRRHRAPEPPPAIEHGAARPATPSG